MTVMHTGTLFGRAVDGVDPSSLADGSEGLTIETSTLATVAVTSVITPLDAEMSNSVVGRSARQP